MLKNFQKISGYKVISRCRNCGARVVGRTESYYCDSCLLKLRNWRADEEDRNERERKAKADAKKPAPKPVAKAPRKAVKKAAVKPVAKKPAKKAVKKAAPRRKAPAKKSKK